MMLAAAGIFLAARRKPKWTNPYVTDGLVAMWDGEWNAGGGVHDAAATTWKDLSGSGYDIALDVSKGAWGDNYLRVSGRAGTGGTIEDGIMTVEFVGRSLRNSSAQVVAAFASQSGQHARGAFYRGNNTFNFGAFGPCYSVNPLIAMYAAEAFKSSDLANKSGTLYKDGVEVPSIGSGAYFSSNLNTIFIGSDGGGSYIFSGDINRLSIYSRALTSAEIAANYAVDKARFNLP